MAERSSRYLANCSLLFTEVPVLQRPAAARAAGFGAIEFWWPFAGPVPGDSDVDAFVAAVRDSGVLSIPARSSEFLDNIDVAVAIGEQLGTVAFNALYGNRVDGVPAAQQDELGTANLAAAAGAAARIGATVLVEAVSGPKPYPVRTADDAVAVVRRARAAGAANVGFLCDLFHLAVNGDDIDAAITRHAGDIWHVQIADVPGRGEPGTGTLDIDGYLAHLQRSGYLGWVGLEYRPTVATEQSLAWLPRERRGTGDGRSGR
jgi:hydroxypyruvate isomerase